MAAQVRDGQRAWKRSAARWLVQSATPFRADRTRRTFPCLPSRARGPGAHDGRSAAASAAATTVEGTNRELILTATAELLERMVQANGIEPEDVASAIFTTSPDLTAEYPALAARLMGWA